MTDRQTNRWFVVGTHRHPTEADLPILAWQLSFGKPYIRYGSVPDKFCDGDKWCHLDLPTEDAPPPEPPTVEIDGRLYRIKDGWLQFQRETGTWHGLNNLSNHDRRQRAIEALRAMGADT